MTIREIFIAVGMEVDKKSEAKVNKGIESFKKGAVKALGAIATVATLIKIKDIAEEFNNINDKIKDATRNLGDQKQIQQQILDAAQRSKTAYGDMADSVSKLVQNKEVFSSVEDASRFAELMAKNFAATGKEGAQVKSLMDSITLSISRGEFSSRTLMQLLRESPSTLNMLADAAGVTSQEFQEMASSGKVSAADLKALFESSASSIEARFGELDYSFSDAMSHLRNEWGMFIDKSLNGSGAMQNMALTVRDTFSEILTALKDSEVVQSLAQIIEKIVRAVTKLFKALTPIVGFLLKILIPIADVIGDIIEGTASFVTWVTDGFRTMSDSARDLEKSTKDLKKSISEGNKEYAAAKQNIDATASVAKKYVDKLKELEAQGLNTAESQDKYAAAVRMINSLIPDLNLQIDAQTGLIEGGTEALYNQVDAWRALAVQQAMQKKQAEFLEKYGDTMVKAETSRMNVDDWNLQLETEAQPAYDELLASEETRIRDIWDQRNALWDSMSADARREYGADFFDAQTWEMVGLEQLETLNAKAKVDGLTGSIINEQKSIDKADDLLKEFAEEHETLQNVMNNLQGDIEEVTGSINLQGEAWEKLKQRASGAANKIINNFKPLTKQDIGAGDATKAMRQSVDDTAKWNNDLEALFRQGYDPQIVADLRNRGMEYAQVVADLANGTDVDRDDFAEAWRAATDIGADMEYSGETSGVAYVDGVLLAVEARMEELRAMGTAVATAITEGMQSAGFDWGANAATLSGAPQPKTNWGALAQSMNGAVTASPSTTSTVTNETNTKNVYFSQSNSISQTFNGDMAGNVSGAASGAGGIIAGEGSRAVAGA